MRHLIIFLLFVTSGSLFAQSGTKMETGRQEVWNTVVKAIIDFNQDKIYELTNFPLEGNWYEQEGQTNEELKVLYKSVLDYFYPQEMRDYLKKKDFTILVAHPYKGSVAFAFTYYDELLETTTILDFAEIDGTWKIVAITIK